MIKRFLCLKSATMRRPKTTQLWQKHTAQSVFAAEGKGLHAKTAYASQESEMHLSHKRARVPLQRVGYICTSADGTYMQYIKEVHYSSHVTPRALSLNKFKRHKLPFMRLDDVHEWPRRWTILGKCGATYAGSIAPVESDTRLTLSEKKPTRPWFIL